MTREVFVTYYSVRFLYIKDVFNIIPCAELTAVVEEHSIQQFKSVLHSNSHLSKSVSSKMHSNYQKYQYSFCSKLVPVTDVLIYSI